VFGFAKNKNYGNELGISNLGGGLGGGSAGYEKWDGMELGYFMFCIIYFIDIDRMGYCLPGEGNVFAFSESFAYVFVIWHLYI
jgi:hypothetical protein